jgi:hypothetical protein
MRLYLQSQNEGSIAQKVEGKRYKREHSSAGSEHLPYKQRVTGSNPVAPTSKKPLD